MFSTQAIINQLYGCISTGHYGSGVKEGRRALFERMFAQRTQTNLIL